MRTRSSAAGLRRASAELGPAYIGGEEGQAHGPIEVATASPGEPHEEAPPIEDADSALARAKLWWRDSVGGCGYQAAIAMKR